MNKTNSKYHLLNTTTFMMGNRKNAGKTTFMNWALNQIRKVEAPAFATIGIDGESNDQINGRAKPLIYTQKGDVLITSYPMLNKSNGQFKIEKAFPIKTPLGQLVAVSTQRAGTIELVGPEHNEQLQQITTFLKQELKCNSIVIDGAASRITPVSAIDNSGFYYVVNIDARNLKKAIEQMQLLDYGSSLEQAKPDTDRFEINGALTMNKVNQLPIDCQSITINDLTTIFLSYEQIKKLSNNIVIRVENKLHLKGFVAILKDISQTEFQKLYQSKNITTPLIYNPYVH